SIKDFCARKGVSKNTFFYRQRKLRALVADTLISQSEELSHELVPSGRALCEAAKPDSVKSAEQTIPIEIGFCRITVGADTDPDLLSKVCKVLTA
ncbi:MAG: IS66 family insertion sequence element accessory protein TnpB, partial [Clostridiales bacterium]|nr:IS66 family insertion sequence element accessory protein TnpB [Clostridiales bacterium]